MRHIKTSSSVQALAIAVGVICLLLSAAAFTRLLMFKRAVGVVHFSDRTERGKAIRHPSIDYTRHTGSRWGHSPRPDEVSPTWSDGDTVTILYAAYGKTSLVASPRLWIYPLAALGLGGLLLFFARFVFLCAPPKDGRLAPAAHDGR